MLLHREASSVDALYTAGVQTLGCALFDELCHQAQIYPQITQITQIQGIRIVSCRQLEMKAITARNESDICLTSCPILIR